MSNTVTQHSLGYVDAKGNQTRMRFYISHDTVANGVAVYDDFASAINALTNGLNFSNPGFGGAPTVSGEYGAADQFESVTDQAVFTAIDAAGQIHRFMVPAPKAAIFLADLLTVNMANAAVGDYTDIITNAGSAASFISTRSGQGFASVPAGLRIKRPNRRRVSVFTKSSNLDEPAE